MKSLRPFIAYRTQNRGMALISVLISLMIVSILLFEFQYATLVEQKLAYNDLNQLQAYYLAKSGVKMSLLRLNLYLRARKDPNLKKNVPNINQYLDGIWAIDLPKFPPDQTKFGKLLKEDKDAAEKVLKETRMSEGQYETRITSESTKINLNFLAVPANASIDARAFLTNPNQGLQQFVAMQFINLVDRTLKDSENPFEEFGPVKAEELVFDIMDYISPGNSRVLGGSKDSFYETLKPPYKAKRQKFYSLDELRLVKDVNNRLYEKIKPFITVYSQDGKININSCSAEMYRTFFKDFTDDDLKRIMEERTERSGWASEKDFVTFVTQTLGRNGFTTLYNDDKNYPFTISSQSFLIQSTGIVSKSKTEVRKTIRVGVALSNKLSAESQKSPQACEKNPYFKWHPDISKCFAKPKTRQECSDIWASSAWDETAKTCEVRIRNASMVIVYPNSATAPNPQDNQDPNSLKITYWSESI